MSRLHKKISFSLAQKTGFLFFFLFLYGWYKNGFLPYKAGFYPISHVFLILFYPLMGFFLGFLFDRFFPNQSMFNNTFYGVLFSLLIPISTPIWLFLLFLALLLSFHTFVIQKRDLDFHFIVFGKLLLVLCLVLIGRYTYANLLEESGMYVYSFLDGILGHNVSSLFTSSVLLLLFSFLFLAFDPFYKKEIPLYSYGTYFLTLLFYAILKNDFPFFLLHFCSSNVFFALIFLAPLSMFSPYSSKRKVFYGVFLGFLILPFSLWVNFYEGVYVSILLANLLILVLNFIQFRKKV